MMVRNLILTVLLVIAVWKVDMAHNAFKPITPFLLSSPISHKIAITGSFGELRSNHFHAGIDMRSAHGVDGDSLLSSADGFIRKIKIDSKNYGKSLLIEHEGGYSTFYAHISKFREDIEDRIKTEQYRRQENELEIEFSENVIPLKLGEHVAYMGNTGDSRGSHLHFELRVTGTDQVVDPSNFGLPIEDDLAPQVRRIKLYGFDLEGNVVSEKLAFSSKLIKVLIPGEVFGMAIEAFDRTNNSWRSTGVKSVRMLIDHSTFYSFSMDQWSLQDTRYINAHIDYRSRYQGKFHRCYKIQGNKIPIYNSVENDGFFYIGDGSEHQVEIIVSDALGNETKKEFTIQNTSFRPKTAKNILPLSLSHDKSFIYDFGFGSFFVDEGCIYDDLNCKIDTMNINLSNSFCPWIGIVPDQSPIHKPFEIKLKPTKAIPDKLIEKCFVGMRRGKSYVSLNGVWNDGILTAKSKQLGYFSIFSDTIPPKLYSRNFKFNMSGKSNMSFTMRDNVVDITESRSGIKYNAYIDGQWVILHHDLKSHSITHTFEPWLSNGAHELLVVLEDSRKNTKEYRFNFYK